jgi:hypothetical protein
MTTYAANRARLAAAAQPAAQPRGVYAAAQARAAAQPRQPLRVTALARATTCKLAAAADRLAR